MASKSKRKVRRRPVDKLKSSFRPAEKDGYLIAAIGASAGGIEAFSELIRNLPADTGMAFVLIQHLNPKHHSILTELVSRETTMRVAEAKHGMVVEPNHVYVIPPNATMSICQHALQISPRAESHGQHMVVDYFMRSLAEDQRNKAIGVILSGSGSDGTLGMGEIQALETTSRTGKESDQFECERVFPNIGRRKLRFRIGVLDTGAGGRLLILSMTVLEVNRELPSAKLARKSARD